VKRIIVNGVEKETSCVTLSYSEVVSFANKEVSHGPTVTFKKKEQCGTLSPGDLVYVEDGINFNVAITSGA
jgi:hypothetical protein